VGADGAVGDGVLPVHAALARMAMQTEVPTPHLMVLINILLSFEGSPNRRGVSRDSAK
jgi:hypothetical protein